MLRAQLRGTKCYVAWLAAQTGRSFFLSAEVNVYITAIHVQSDGTYGSPRLDRQRRDNFEVGRFSRLVTGSTGGRQLPTIPIRMGPPPSRGLVHLGRKRSMTYT